MCNHQLDMNECGHCSLSNRISHPRWGLRFWLGREEIFGIPVSQEHDAPGDTNGKGGFGEKGNARIENRNEERRGGGRVGEGRRSCKREGGVAKGEAELGEGRRSCKREAWVGGGKAKFQKGSLSWGREGEVPKGKAELGEGRRSWGREGGEVARKRESGGSEGEKRSLERLIVSS